MAKFKSCRKKIVEMFIFLFTSVVQAQGCSDPKSLSCFNQLQQLQSAQECGSVTLVMNESMGHMMPVEKSWTSCACSKLPAIIDCLSESTCPEHLKLADDFSGPVMHCDMEHDMTHGVDHDHAVVGHNATTSATPAKTSPTSSPSSTTQGSSDAMSLGASLWLLLALL